jgi:hypothetical protein
MVVVVYEKGVPLLRRNTITYAIATCLAESEIYLMKRVTFASSVPSHMALTSPKYVAFASSVPSNGVTISSKLRRVDGIVIDARRHLAMV